MKQAKDRLELSTRSTRPANVEKQVAQATKDIEDISSEIEDQLKAQPAPLRKKQQ